jgi:hypothetical protein
MNADWLTFLAAAVGEMFTYGDVFIFDSLARGVCLLDGHALRQHDSPDATPVPC